MRLPTGPFVFTALCLFSIPREILAQADRPLEARWSCFTEYGQSAIYTTQVWEATALLIEVTNDFGRFLLAEYGPVRPRLTLTLPGRRGTIVIATAVR